MFLLQANDSSIPELQICGLIEMTINMFPQTNFLTLSTRPRLDDYAVEEILVKKLCTAMAQMWSTLTWNLYKCIMGYQLVPITVLSLPSLYLLLLSPSMDLSSVVHQSSYPFFATAFQYWLILSWFAPLQLGVLSYQVCSIRPADSQLNFVHITYCITGSTSNFTLYTAHVQGPFLSLAMLKFYGCLVIKISF